MSRRSPHNERYKKGQTPKGVSKKSAASAKPARKKGKESEKKKSTAAKTAVSYQPDWPEYKAARKKWWIALGAPAILLTLILFVPLDRVQEVVPLDETILFSIQTAMTGITFGLIAFAWWIDIKQLRPMMKAYQAGLSFEEYKAGGTGKSED